MNGSLKFACGMFTFAGPVIEGIDCAHKAGLNDLSLAWPRLREAVNY
jgi:hypothetical protein